MSTGVPDGPRRGVTQAEHNSSSATGAIPGALDNGISVHSVYNSVIAETLNNTHGINFEAHASPQVEGPNQAIYAKHIEIHGQVTFNTMSTHGTDNSTIEEWLYSLSPLSFQEKHKANTHISKKGPEVGRWFLDSPEFTKWRDGEYRRLWCYGIPGAGKTILMSRAINHLEGRPTCGRQGIACIYAYLDYRDQKRQDTPNLLGNLLAQLVRKGGDITNCLRQHWKQLKATRDCPTLDQYLEMLKSQINLFSRVFIVIDALDEYLNDSKINNLDQLLDLLGDLPDNVHFLFTSRDDGSIKKKVQADKEVEIIAKDDDIKLYVETCINPGQELRGANGFVDAEIEKTTGLREEIVNAIVARSQGMLLLTQLHLDFIASKHNIRDMKSGLSHLPQAPDKVYEIALHRINSQPDEFKRKLGIDVLMWLVFAERPLTIDELTHAVGVQRDDKKSEGRHVTDETLTSACAGIVMIDPGTRGVRLAHYTAKQYLRDNERHIFSDPHSKIAEICLVYLSFQNFDHTANTDEERLARQETYPFLKYAADHWGHHLASARLTKDMSNLAHRFLCDPPKVTNALQYMSHFRFRFEAHISALHLVAYFGAKKLAKRLLGKGYKVNAVTHRGETPLHWAVFHRHERFIKLLVSSGAELNMKDNEGRTVFQKAIRNDDMRTVDLLLAVDQKVDLELEDSKGWTPLRWAAAYGTIAVVKRLLQSGVNINAEDGDGFTALRWAAQKGRVGIVELLVQHGASVEIPSPDRWTLLTSAARGGLKSIISLLLERGVDLDVADGDGLTALRGAIDYGHGMIVWLLIQAGANIEKPDNKGFTPLHSVIQLWSNPHAGSMLWLLLENQAQVNAPTKHGLTALHLAAGCDYSRGAWLLMEKGAGPMSVDNNGRTPLHYAVTEEHFSVAEMLIRRTKELARVPDEDGQTPLHIAASAGYLNMVVLLLDHNVDIDAQDGEGYTPLHRAVSQQQESVVFCLTNKGASLNTRNRAGRTVFDTAKNTRNETIIKKLHDCHGPAPSKGKANRVKRGYGS